MNKKYQIIWNWDFWWEAIISINYYNTMPSNEVLKFLSYIEEYFDNSNWDAGEWFFSEHSINIIINEIMKNESDLDSFMQEVNTFFWWWNMYNIIESLIPRRDDYGALASESVWFDVFKVEEITL